MNFDYNNNSFKEYNITINEEIQKKIHNLVYVPLRTIKECNKWGQEVLNIKHVDYIEFDLSLANRINRQLQIMFYLYPEIKTIRWVSDIESSAEKYFKYSKFIREYYNYLQNYIYDISKDNLATCITEDCEYKGIWFNGDKVKDSKALELEIKYYTENSFFAKSNYGIESTVTHEFAHHIENFLKRNNLFEYMESIWSNQQSKIKNKKKRSIRTRRTIKRALCEYASIDIGDFFSEGINEYINNPQPRPLAKKIGEETDRVFSIFRFQNKVGI